ncbi:putative phage abortive infection protein [Leptospira sp. WS39.C2]
MNKIIIFGFLILVFGLILIHFPFLWEPLNLKINVFDLNKSSDYGGYLSGYVGSFLLLLNILLLLYIHYEQAKSEFEKQFYTFLDIHRSNVERIRYLGFTSTEAIEKIVEFYDNILNEFIKNGWKNNPFEQKLNEAYFVIFYGYNERAFQIVNKNYNKNSSDYYSRITNIIFHTKGAEKVEYNEQMELPGLEKYLSTYFRHLFQIVRFIDESDKLTNKQKFIFSRILRAQLTNHEQALLLINSLGIIGKEWKYKNYLVKYQLVKNIPKGFFQSFDHELYFSGIRWEYLDYSNGV